MLDMSPYHCHPTRNVRDGGKSVLLDELQLNSSSSLRYSEQRRASVQTALDALRLAFQGISFELIEDCLVINAQAIFINGAPCVRIYGGLAFHPSVDWDALILISLHETGHHLSRGCRLPWNPLLGCECAADQWAVDEGSVELQSRSGVGFKLSSALGDLESLFCLRDQAADKSLDDAASIFNSDDCWAWDWRLRSVSLLRRRKIRAKSCPLARMALADRGAKNGDGAGK
jgi:hypothetical protein